MKIIAGKEEADATPCWIGSITAIDGLEPPGAVKPGAWMKEEEREWVILKKLEANSGRFFKASVSLAIISAYDISKNIWLSTPFNQ